MINLNKVNTENVLKEEYIKECLNGNNVDFEKFEKVKHQTVYIVITDKGTNTKIDYYKINRKLKKEIEELISEKDYYKDCTITFNGIIGLEF